jgi:SAM-dependent methyltransferase
LDSILQERKAAWDKCARDNGFYYIATRKAKWEIDEFFASGKEQVTKLMEGMKVSGRMLEIGCGAGRTTRAFADMFDEVVGVDISSEMIKMAQELNKDKPKIHFNVNNGADLSGFPNKHFDFVFSYLVFQHIPSKQIIQSYLNEIARVLKSDGKFKFQVNGAKGDSKIPSRTIHNFLVTSKLWKPLSVILYNDVNLRAAFPGLLFSEKDVRRMTDLAGLDVTRVEGQDTIEMWFTGIKS